MPCFLSYCPAPNTSYMIVNIQVHLTVLFTWLDLRLDILRMNYSNWPRFLHVCLFAEWHRHCQDQKVYDKPAASEEANGKCVANSGSLKFRVLVHFLTCIYSSCFCFRLSMSCIQAEQQSLRPRSGRSLQKCTKPPQMWCSSSASKLSLVVARQQGSAWFTTRWTTPRKMSPNTGCRG